MSKSNSNSNPKSSKKRTNENQPHSHESQRLSDKVREMRLDTAHRVGSGETSSTENKLPAVDFEQVHSPHIETAGIEIPVDTKTEIDSPLESLEALESVLFEAWNELGVAPGEDLADPLSEPLIEEPISLIHPSLREPIVKSTSADADAANSVEAAAMIRTARTQIQQLTTLLQQRQLELDRRESNQLARQAELDQNERSFQFWLREQHEQLESRKEEIAEREKSSISREETLGLVEQGLNAERSTAEHEMQVRREQFELREERLREWEITLSERTSRLELHERNAADHEQSMREQTSCLAVEAELLTQRHDALKGIVQDYLRGETPRQVAIDSLRRLPSQLSSTQFDTALSFWDGAELQQFVRMVQELGERRNRIDEIEALYERSTREMNEMREQFMYERKLWEARKTLEQRDLDEEHKHFKVMVEQQRAAIHLAEQQVETRRAGLDQLREELAITQRDVLQERLALEEAMAEFSAVVSGANRTEALMSGRTKVANFTRLQIEQLANERRNLEVLLTEIPDQQQLLQQRQQDVEQWLRDRQGELTDLATKLAMREQELDRRGELFAKLQVDWAKERADYQRELRRLLSEIGR